MTYTPPNGSLIRIEQVPRTIPAAALALEDDQGVVAELTADGSLLIFSHQRLEHLSAGWDMPGRTAISVIAKLVMMATGSERENVGFGLLCTKCKKPIRSGADVALSGEKAFHHWCST